MFMCDTEGAPKAGLFRVLLIVIFGSFVVSTLFIEGLSFFSTVVFLFLGALMFYVINKAGCNAVKALKEEASTPAA